MTFRHEDPDASEKRFGCFLGSCILFGIGWPFFWMLLRSWVVTDDLLPDWWTPERHGRRGVTPDMNVIFGGEVLMLLVASIGALFHRSSG